MAAAEVHTAPLPRLLTTYHAARLDELALRATLAQAPVEGSPAPPLVLPLPLPDGTLTRFAVVESSIMEPELAAQFPQITTYVGRGVDDPTATLRADLTPAGFHAQLLSAVTGTSYIDPVAPTDRSAYVAYAKDARDPATRPVRLPCEVLEHPEAPPVPAASGSASSTPARVTVSSGATLRTYRLALATTGEYVAARGGTLTSAMSAITTSINRVVGVYERELAVRLRLVANNSTIIFLNAATDPYTNTNPSALLTQNQTTLTARIGAANYDIGHVFSTGGGGVAVLRSVCNPTVKAQGETGSPSPVGDAFDIDYVAHEMGHQFGGNHPFNGTQLNCAGGNRNATTAWEPGSGSTIMAYAGICGTDDLQPHSDPYFHSGSFEEMTAFINTTTCAVTATTGNTPPTVTVPAARTIPRSTPFVVTATGADANGDALTYCWEELDLGPAGPPAPTQVANQTPPLFRSFAPTASNARYFPRLADLRTNVAVKGQVLPAVARTIRLRCTARDQHTSTTVGGVVGGVTTSALLTLTVSGTAGPFTVTAPNLSTVVWTVGTQVPVTWSVAGTNLAPISCTTVRLLLSRDGGLTFPTVLAASVPNTGSATITVPNLPTTQARVMVMANGNYFFDISNLNFRIVTPPARPTLLVGVDPDTATVCASHPLRLLVTVLGLDGFNAPTQLSMSGLPPGVSARFGRAVLTPGDTTYLVLTATSAAGAALTQLTVTGTAAGETAADQLTLAVLPSLSRVATLRFPPNYAPVQGSRPRFEWGGVPGATGYSLEMSTTASFSPATTMMQGELTDTVFQWRGALPLDTTQAYYWRITATNGCETGSPSSPFVFGPGGASGLRPDARTAAVTVAPNPTTGAVTLTLPYGVVSGAAAQVLDALGRVVQYHPLPVSAEPATHELLLPDLPGLYYLLLTAPGTKPVTRTVMRW